MIVAIRSACTIILKLNFQVKRSEVNAAKSKSDELQSNRLHAGALDVHCCGRICSHFHHSVSAGRPTQADAHETDAVRMRKRSGWLGTRAILSQVLSNSNALYFVRH